MQRDWYTVVTRAVFAMLGVLLLVLVATGVWLTFEYRPTVEAPQPLRRVHRVASLLAVYAAFAGLALALYRRQKGPGLVAIPVAVLIAVWSFTGYLLPWDQLALWAVSTGLDIDGVLHVFGDDVRFVLMGGAEVAKSTYQRWVVVHIAVLPGLLLLLGVVTSYRRRRRSAPRTFGPAERT